MRYSALNIFLWFEVGRSIRPLMVCVNVVKVVKVVVAATATFVGSDFRRPDLSSPTRNDTTIRGGTASFSVSRSGNHH
jgi:hypothetical protein